MIEYTRTFAPPLTVTGVPYLYAMKTVNNTTFVVDHPDNEIYLDHDISGTGSFEASAGVIELFPAISFDGLADPLTWKLSGSGVMEIPTVCPGCTDFNGKFEISGNATLDVDASLRTEGNLTFSGGTIDVAASTSAQFRAADCSP